MRALVLSGGGSKGAYQVGALQYLMGELGHQYEILCGVSVGAINCAFISMFKLRDELDCAKLLKKLWSQLDNTKIYKRWSPFGRWHAIWKSSFYDSSPLNDLIKTSIDLKKIRASKKKVYVGAVSLSSGKYTIFDHNSDDFLDAVVASASFPGMLTPVKIKDQLWTDGGIKEISPIKTAIDSGATEIDIIITSPEIRIKHWVENPSTADVIKRALDLSTDKILANDVEKVLMYNKLAQANLTDKKYVKLNIIRPRHNLIEDLLNFSPLKIKEMMEKGYNDAKFKYNIE